MTVGTGKVLKYALLPGILPRVTGFFSSGFAHLALYMACAFRAARLLPPGHPYLSVENAGRYGIRHVLSEARRHLVFRRENIDQIIIYYTIIAGFFLMLFQFGMISVSASMQAAHAAGITPANLVNYFTTPGPAAPGPNYDIAFILLDYVFGVRGIFTDVTGTPTCLAVNLPCAGGGASMGAWPTPWHDALHFMFRFYNTGVLAVALIVFLYLVVTTTIETAQTGTPFGYRFNRVWAPVRMIFALAMLMMVPMGTAASPQFGFNIAQIFTLHVAKWGSGLATRAWNNFNAALTGNAATIMGTQAQLVYDPTPPSFNTFQEFMLMAHTCIAAEKFLNGRDVRFYQVRQAIPGDNGNPALGIPPSPGSPEMVLIMQPTFTNALTISANRDIYIRVGELNPAYTEIPGNVAPVCGEFVYRVQDLGTPGAYTLQEQYYDMIYDMTLDPIYINDGEYFARQVTPTTDRDPLATPPDMGALQLDYVDYYTARVQAAIAAGRTAQITAPSWVGAVTARGWGGAGIWYNHLAEYNGSLIAAAYSLPVPRLYPQVLEKVRKERSSHFSDVIGMQRFNPTLAGGGYVDFDRSSDLYVALAIYNAQRSWEGVYERAQGNTLIDTIRALFGVQGLYNYMNNTTVHPFVQLIGIGRSLVESAMVNLGVAFGSIIAGGIANVLGYAEVGAIGKGAASTAGQVAVLGMSMGFVLAYVVPMLPFLYFFFAVGGWVKGIFEAMVGLPLWAMAHIRIDGDGIPGSAALNGYYLIFEILIRPLLIVFGLIAGITIFAAQVFVLHSIWMLAVTNLTGFDGLAAGRPAPGSDLTGSLEFAAGSVNAFFFTIVYAIMGYMMAMSSFKLIDLIPDKILRWMGTGVQSFGEIESDPAQHLVQYGFMGANLISGQVNKGIQSLLQRNS